MVLVRDRNDIGEYHNIIELAALFIASQYMDMITYYGAYDTSLRLFDTRRIVVINVVLSSILIILSAHLLLLLATLKYLFS
jgi:hypothetical protein